MSTHALNSVSDPHSPDFYESVKELYNVKWTDFSHWNDPVTIMTEIAKRIIHDCSCCTYYENPEEDDSQSALDIWCKKTFGIPTTGYSSMCLRLNALRQIVDRVKAGDAPNAYLTNFVLSRLLVEYNDHDFLPIAWFIINLR